MVISPVYQVWPKPSCKAQWKGEEDKADRERGGKTTSGNGHARSSPSPVGNRGKWRKLVAKSSVVPQRSSRLRYRWWWWWPCGTVSTGGMHDNLSLSSIRMNVVCSIGLQLMCFVYNERVPWFIFWRVCSESTSLSLRCYTLACGTNMAATVRAFRTEYCSWRCDWLKLFWFWQSGALCCVALKVKKEAAWNGRYGRSLKALSVLDLWHHCATIRIPK